MHGKAQEGWLGAIVERPKDELKASKVWHEIHGLRDEDVAHMIKIHIYIVDRNGSFSLGDHGKGNGIGASDAPTAP